MPTVCLMWIDAPEIADRAVPGQFMMASCSIGNDPLWRRPISIHRLGRNLNGKMAATDNIPPSGVAILFYISKTSLSSQWLSSRKVGEKIDLFGPLGNGYTIEPQSRNLLLIGGGTGIAPLIALADEAIPQGCSITILSAGKTALGIYPHSLVPPEVEYIPVTEDGSLGVKGLVTDHIKDYVGKIDQLFICGSTSMSKAIANLCAQEDIKTPCQILMEVKMACGIGICYGCAVETKEGMQLVCVKGPRFDLNQISWGQF